MNGGTIDPTEVMMIIPSSARNMIKGISQNFFRVLINKNNSFKKVKKAHLC
jgi:hypothetical protein